LAPVAQEAVALWAASGLSPAQVADLQTVQYQIVTPPEGVLGWTVPGSPVVTLSATAAGYGWFLDVSLADSSAFELLTTPQELQAAPGSPAYGHMDLLTVVEHELGHVLGLGDLDPQAVPHDLMTETLATGVRRLPTTSFAKVDAPALESTDTQAPASAGGNDQLAASPAMNDLALAIALAQVSIKGTNQATNPSAVNSAPPTNSSWGAVKSWDSFLWAPYRLRRPTDEAATLLLGPDPNGSDLDLTSLTSDAAETQLTKSFQSVGQAGVDLGDALDMKNRG